MSRLRLDKEALFTVTLSPSQVTNGHTTQQTFTVQGLNVGDIVLSVLKPTTQDGLFVLPGKVTAANTLGIIFVNYSASPITPTATEVYTIAVRRPDDAAVSNAAVFN